ncbi:flagellar type III secretion system pore protein FliP [Nocardioides rubriscoriae]|uniref:flagellar type III secretion system pore protein FliP n=1 Tax=Nocardioides rubriscoriae TaxID=642762 RepID=UPI001FEA50BE|nr:flagellar type III secretion system pore protein FliP [Nocardioides rubriscoriae]
MTRPARHPHRWGAVLLAALVLGLGLLLGQPAAGHAAPADPGASTALTASAGAVASTASVSTADPGKPGPQGPGGPKGPKGPKNKNAGDGSVNVSLDGLTDKPSTSVTLLLTITLLSVAPALLLTCTSFTKILVVLGLTRNALGLQQTPPNQVLAGLALFLSLFIMSPVLSEMNDLGLQPYMNGDATAAEAFTDGVAPLRTFMLDQTGDDELELLTNVAHRDLPKDRTEVSLSTLVPAFVLSELKQAFIIGFIIFIPFLVIDIVVSGALMALGMMMMPPVMVSLPFKLLLFVLVDGWALVVTSLVQSYNT